MSLMNKYSYETSIGKLSIEKQFYVNKINKSKFPEEVLHIIKSYIFYDTYIYTLILNKNILYKLINSTKWSRKGMNIPDSDIAPGGADHLISASFLYVNAEQLVTALADKGYSVDSGSACSAANMQPSHVLAALGLLTQGNIRLTIHHATIFDDVKTFLEILSQTVTECRGAK
jgi:hypothetical protein